MPELGIWLRKEAQDQGYGREMLTTVIAWAIDRFKPQGFIYPVAEENLRSRRLAEGLGGVLTGGFPHMQAPLKAPESGFRLRFPEA